MSHVILIPFVIWAVVWIRSSSAVVVANTSEPSCTVFAARW
ncbi:hypothetical protein GBAR_LOCUS8779, partial [Geodia barretti]